MKIVSIIIFISILCIYLLFCPYKHKIKNIQNINIQPYKQKIEKNIFQIWKDKNLPKKFKKITEYLKKQNPEYNYYLYDDNDMEKFVKKYYPQYWNSYNSIAKEYIVAKGDFFRYMIIYHYGGVYFDIKSGCKLPLRDIIKPNDEFISSGWKHWVFKIDNNLQWCVIGKKGHPLLKIVLDTINHKIKNYNVKKDGVGGLGVFELTGPNMFDKVIEENKYKYRNQITRYSNQINNNLIYSYLDRHFFDQINCSFIGYCVHSNPKTRYTKLKTPIIMSTK